MFVSYVSYVLKVLRLIFAETKDYGKRPAYFQFLVLAMAFATGNSAQVLFADITAGLYFIRLCEAGKNGKF